MADSKPPEKSRLGRGLSALIPPTVKTAVPLSSEERPSAEERHSRLAYAPSVEPDGVQEIALSAIVPNTLQPRTVFEEDALQELAASIKMHGVLQPIMVRPRGGGRYELVAGERRFRAAEQAGLRRIPAVIRSLTDEESLTVALIENIQREDLNPMEAARGYKQLMEQFGLSQTELAQHLGKKQPSIANFLRLLNLPEDIQESVALRQITVEHGKILLSITDPKKQWEIWQDVVGFRLNVRDTQKYADAANILTPGKAAPAAKAVIKDVHWQSLEDQFRTALGMKVGIKPTRSGRGTMTIEFSNAEEVEDLLQKLSILL